jgi:hypothetical protein
LYNQYGEGGRQAEKGFKKKEEQREMGCICHTVYVIMRTEGAEGGQKPMKTDDAIPNKMQ